MEWFIGLLCVVALCWSVSEIFAPRRATFCAESKGDNISDSPFRMNARISDTAISSECRYVIYRCGHNGRNCGATKGYGAIRAPEFCPHGAIAEDDWDTQNAINERYKKEIA